MRKQNEKEHQLAMVNKWTKQEVEFLSKNYRSTDTKELANKLSRTSFAVSSKAKVLKLSKGRFYFTPESTALLIELYPDTLNKLIAAALGCSQNTIENKAHLLGLRKDPELIRETGRRTWLKHRDIISKTCFKKGHIPFNKGKKMPSVGRTTETQFKKGNIPSNHLEVGTEVIDSYGYRKVKVAEPNKWKFKHHLVWIKQNGEISKGINLVFRDGNPGNCSIENLELIDNAENMRRNTIQRYPKELMKTIRAVGKLKKELKRAKKQIS